MTYAIEIIGSNDSGPCQCCGNMSRKVWGFLKGAGNYVAVYYVHWTIGRLDHGANIDLLVGPWNSGSTGRDRSLVAVVFRIISGEPQFMVVDAINRSVAKNDSLVKKALRREQVIGTSLATDVFKMLDSIWIGDDRIGELTGKTKTS